MSSAPPPRVDITPIEQTREAFTETQLTDVVARYREYNDALAKRLDGLPVPKPLEPTTGAYSVQCFVCAKHGPPGETIFSGTMAAQRAGYTYDSESLKAGAKVKWFCPDHGRKP